MQIPDRSEPCVLLTNSPEFGMPCTNDTVRDAVTWTRGLRTGARICGPLSVRAVWGGSETCTVGRRTLCVDEDNYLVINAGREYAVRPDRNNTGESLTVFVSEATQRTCGKSQSAVPGCGSHGNDSPELFAEYLRPHGDSVSQCMQRIRDARRRGITDNGWYSKQLRTLYAQLVESDDRLYCRAIVFAPASGPTRTELLRRVMTATDYINSNYMSAITLDDIACAALLSKFHLARLFRVLHGVSPAAYLRAKRIRTAERLIERSDADLFEIAERSGFGSRWSMFRALRQRRGMSGQRIRESWSRAIPAPL